jgi:hypothetical protein
VNAPQFKSFAKSEDVRQSRQRLDCGRFSAALPPDNADVLAFSPRSISGSFKA